MIADSAVSREKIKRATKAALLEWLAQSQRLIIARDHHGLVGARWVDFAGRLGVDRASAYRLAKLWQHRTAILKRCVQDGYYPGWEVCLYWFMREPRRSQPIEVETRPTEVASQPTEVETRYWLTPPDLKAKLEREFPGYWDACPHPRPAGLDALAKKEWPSVVYCNAPYFSRDEINGRGLSTWVRKAIAEAAKGKTVAMVIPSYETINLLIEAGAEVRSLGRVKWREIDTGEPSPNPQHSTLFVLRGAKKRRKNGNVRSRWKRDAVHQTTSRCSPL
jgi:hypothetical protein